MGDISEKYILIGGSANPPKETGVYKEYGVVSLTMYVNRETHVVEHFQLNLPSPLTQEYVADIVEGYCILDNPEKLFSAIHDSVLISSGGAIVQALKVAFARYRDKLA